MKNTQSIVCISKYYTNVEIRNIDKGGYEKRCSSFASTIMVVDEPLPVDTPDRLTVYQPTEKINAAQMHIQYLHTSLHRRNSGLGNEQGLLHKTPYSQLGTANSRDVAQCAVVMVNSSPRERCIGSHPLLRPTSGTSL